MRKKSTKYKNINNDKLGPVGYCIITTENIETYGFLKEINI